MLSLNSGLKGRENGKMKILGGNVDGGGGE